MSGPKPKYDKPGPVFLSPDELYGLHNFQNDIDLESLTELLRQPPGQRVPVILLAGEAGIGKRYFLEAAIHRARVRRPELLHSTLDLTGFNPDDANRRLEDEEIRARC